MSTRNAGKYKLKRADVLKLLKEKRNMNWMARQAGVEWHTMRRFINRDPILLEMHNGNMKASCETARDHIRDAIEEGDINVCKWFLSKIDPVFKDTIQLDGDVDVKIQIAGLSAKKLNLLEQKDDEPDITLIN